jgi:hypothetical protein
MPTTELPGWLALTALCLIAFGSLCYATAGITALTRALRRPRPPAVDWDDLDRACCLHAWETRGRHHDLTHCRRTT